VTGVQTCALPIWPDIGRCRRQPGARARRVSLNATRVKTADPAQPLSRPAVGADVDLEPVPDEPALMADDILVVADLHIGIEEELHEKGIRVPSRAEVMGRKLVELADRRGASRLVSL